MGYRNTHLVLAEVDNPETGGEELAVFGPFTGTERAAAFRDKLLKAVEKPADVAYNADGTSVNIYVYSMRDAKIRAGKARILEMIEQVQ